MKGIKSDYYQSINSFLKTPKMQLTSEQEIFVITNYNYLRTIEALKRLNNSFNNAFGIEFRQLK